MKKTMLSLLLVVVMLFGMLPMTALADNAAPSFEKVSMTLNSILNVQFMVDPNGTDMSDCYVLVTIGDDTSYQRLDTYTSKDGLCVYTAELMAHRIPETITASLMNGASEVETKTFRVADYAAELKNIKDSPELDALLDAMVDYGTYAAAYAGETVASVPAVEAVSKSQFADYKLNLRKNDISMGLVASLYLDEACDLRIKVNSTAFEGCTLWVKGNAVDASELMPDGSKLVYSITEILPQDWNEMYNIQIKNGEDVLVDVDYSVLSYAYTALGKAQEAKTGLNGLLKAMYLYSAAAEAYAALPPVEEPEDEMDPTVAALLAPESWNNNGTVNGDSLVLTQNPVLMASYFKSLWDAGYTHLVFTANLDTAGAYVHGSDLPGTENYKRQYRELSANTDHEIRLDINEFHDGDTWYNMYIWNMTGGNMTVSNPRAYKSPETLLWKKDTPNMYFANEDGYYVLSTYGGYLGVTSPTEWLEKFCIGDHATAAGYTNVWHIYSDYITKGDNYRSLLGGWGDVNGSNDFYSNTEPAWVAWNAKKTAYAEGDVFALYMEKPGVARFKISDIVSNSTSGEFTYIDDSTFQFITAQSFQKYYLATTQEWIAAGATKLNITLTGEPPANETLWYGDDWGDNSEAAVDPTKFADGQYTFQYDLSNIGENEYFTLTAANQTPDNPVSMQVHIEPVFPIEHQVTAPTGEGFTFSGAQTVMEGESYSFTVTPEDAYATATVKINGSELSGVDGTYTVENVAADLVITVELQIPTATGKLLMPQSWNNGGTIGDGTLTVPANSILTAEYLKSLWDAGYTHLVFTANLDTAGAYIHSSSVWDRQYRELPANTDNEIRLDINEYHDGDTWYTMNFYNMTSGNVTISNPRAYKSPETLLWTKDNPNIYFANEDGTYVLSCGVNGYKGVTSPTEWLEKYCVGDHAASKTWYIYTDYIDAGNNTVSLLYGWGSPLYQFFEDTTGGWRAFNEKKNAYSEGEKFGLYLQWGGVARFKIMDVVSDTNTGSVTYIDDSTFQFTSTTAWTKYLYAPTQELIAAGATKLNVTLTGSLADGVELWYGDDDWYGDGGEAGINGGHFVDGQYTFQVDLSMMGEGEYFTITPVGNSADNPITDMQVHIEPVMDGKPTAKKAIVLSSDALASVGTAIANELNSVDSGYTVYTQAQAEAVKLQNSIILGSGETDVSFRSASEGEAYAVVGDGTNIYIDGNCDRALTYGAYDLLRSLGYEFYSADVTTRPASLNIDYSVNIQDSADFAVRAYLSGNTSYVSTNDQKAFTAASKNNNGQFVDLSGFGGTVDYGYYDNPSHNFTAVFADQTEGKYGKSVATGNGDNAFAPCLTNGITYNTDGTDTTLTYAVARMKTLILNNPDKYYFTFCQNDGPNWYCNCEHCEASNTQYKHSGTLVNFVNAMISALKADPELADRDFNIITLAYSFTADAPNGVVPCKDLVIWYANYQDSRYSITSSSQKAAFKDNLTAWMNLTNGENDGSVALWLYDTSFNNYINYYSSTTVNNAVDETIAAAKAAGIRDILVLGAYDSQNNWQADMKAYIWSAKLWDSSKTTAQLQEAFINAYFGPAASYAKEFMSIYDKAQKDLEADWWVKSGSGFYGRNEMRMSVHGKAVQQALDAVAATQEGSVYYQHANGLLASAYAAIIYGYDEHLSDCTGILAGYYGYDDYAQYLGDDKAAFTQMLKAAFANAGITEPCEYHLTVDQWLEQKVANKAY